LKQYFNVHTIHAVTVFNRPLQAIKCRLELENFSGNVKRKSRRKRKKPEEMKIRRTISLSPLLDNAIDELRGELSRSTFIENQLLKTINIEVKV